MIITITVTKKNPIHITFQVFVNHGLSGSLILRNEEWGQFMAILQPDKIRDNTDEQDEIQEDTTSMEEKLTALDKIK